MLHGRKCHISISSQEGEVDGEEKQGFVWSGYLAIEFVIQTCLVLPRREKLQNTVQALPNFRLKIFVTAKIYPRTNPTKQRHCTHRRIFN